MVKILLEFIISWAIAFFGVSQTPAGKSTLDTKRSKNQFPYLELQGLWDFINSLPSASNRLRNEFEGIYDLHCRKWKKGKCVRGRVESRYRRLLKRCPDHKNVIIEHNLDLLEKYEKH